MKIEDLKRPTFVGLRFDGPSNDIIMGLSKGVPNRTSKDDLHITLIYSRKPILMSPLGDLERPISVKASHYTIFTSRSGEKCLVVEVDAPEVVTRHQQAMRDYGASYDFPEYRPHFTLSYDCGVGFDIKSLPPVETIPILRCNHEYAMPLNDT